MRDEQDPPRPCLCALLSADKVLDNIFGTVAQPTIWCRIAETDKSFKIVDMSGREVVL